MPSPRRGFTGPQRETTADALRGSESVGFVSAQFVHFLFDPSYQVDTPIQLVAEGI